MVRNCFDILSRPRMHVDCDFCTGEIAVDTTVLDFLRLIPPPAGAPQHAKSRMIEHHQKSPITLEHPTHLGKDRRNIFYILEREYAYHLVKFRVRRKWYVRRRSNVEFRAWCVRACLCDEFG